MSASTELLSHLRIAVLLQAPGEFVMNTLLSPKWDELQVFDIYRNRLQDHKGAFVVLLLQCVFLFNVCVVCTSGLIQDLSWFDRCTAVVYATKDTAAATNRTVDVRATVLFVMN